jgi:hypothetical protein
VGFRPQRPDHDMSAAAPALNARFCDGTLLLSRKLYLRGDFRTHERLASVRVYDLSDVAGRGLRGEIHEPLRTGAAGHRGAEPSEHLHTVRHRPKCLVTELVEGEKLTERLLRGALLVDEALGAGSQIAEALQFAHR